MRAAPNLSRAAVLMEECGVEAVIACSPVNVRWLTGFGNWLGPAFREYMGQPGASDDLAQRTFVFLPRGGEPVMIVEPSFVLDATDAAVIDVRVAGSAAFTYSDGSSPHRALDEGDPARTLLLAGGVPDDPVSALATLVEEHGLACSQLGIEAGAMHEHERRELASSLSGAKLLDCEMLLRLMRVVKTPAEIDLIARATEIGERAALRVAEGVRETSTPAEIVDHFRALVAEDGADLDHVALSLDGLGFVTGGDRTLVGGTAMYYDYGCVHRGWVSDAGTTLCLGEPGRLARAEHAAVRDAVAAGADALRPGVSGSSVQRTMRECLADAGFTNASPHGHGVGLEVREYPILLPADGRTIRDDCIELSADLPLEQDMVLNLEATVLILGERSVHCEETFVVTSQGCSPLVEQYRDAPLVGGARHEHGAGA